MQKPFELQKPAIINNQSMPKHINFATKKADGKLEVEKLSPEELAIRTGQSFVWTNELLVDPDVKLPQWQLLKMAAWPDSAQINQLAERLSDKCTLIFSKNNYFHYFTKDKKQGRTLTYLSVDKVPVENIEALKGIFSTVQEETSRVADSNELKVIASVIGCFDENWLVNDTVTNVEFEMLMKEVQQNHNKLAVMKVNDLVGYGIVAIDYIPAGSVVTFYAGCLSSKQLMDCNYGVSYKSLTTDGKFNRNHAGFITHAWNNRSRSRIKSSHFYPILEGNCQASAQEIKTWKKNLLSENVTPHPVLIHKKLPYMFFKNSASIFEKTLLAWSYGEEFWDGGLVQPALLTVDGEVIDPSTYQYIPNFTTREKCDVCSGVRRDCHRTERDTAIRLT